MLTHSGCWLNERVDLFRRVSVPRAQEFIGATGAFRRRSIRHSPLPAGHDLVRAIVEGLTDYDPNARAGSGVATRWEASNGGRTWTFHLREDAQWSNGEVG